MNTITKTESVARAKSISVFYEAYNQIGKVIPFDQTWKNGTGYFDHAVNGVILAPGEYAKSYCDVTDRMIVMLGTIFGNIVVFERYTGGDDGVFVSNAPHALRTFRLVDLPHGRLGESDLLNILGMWNGIRSDGTKYRGTSNLSEHLNRMAILFANAANKTDTVAKQD